MIAVVVDRVLEDRYRLIHRIGGGGMGAVFEAEDLALRRHVAVKLLAGVGARDRAFLREARALSRLRHPGIVQLFDAGSDHGDAYLVMELVRGTTLRDLLAQGPLAPEEVMRIGRELAEALAHAHRLGVVHRDLSPGNVLLDESRRVRLADFGIARLSEATATASAEVWGTPAYMAPEQVAGDPVGPPADVYALGLVLLEALTGERAFAGAPAEAGFARLHRDPHVPADLPGSWAALLRAMTAREPGDRPYAVSAAARLGTPPEALRALALPVAAQAAPETVAAAPPADATRRLIPTAPAAAVAPPRWWQRPSAAVTGLLLTAALLVGLATRSERTALPEAVATPSPVAEQVTSPPPPPDPPPAGDAEDDKDEDKDDKDEDKDDDGEGEGNGRGKGNKDKD